MEGVGAMGVAGTAGLLEVWVEVLEKLDGTYPVSAQSALCIRCFQRFWGLPGEIMMVSISFEKINWLNLSICLLFVLLCLCSFILFINNLHLSRSKSGSVSWNMLIWHV